MKQLIELRHNLSDREYFLAQFKKTGEKNFLFVNPNMSGRHFYRMMLPAMMLPKATDGKVATAITNISEYGLYKQITSYVPFSLFSQENDSQDKEMMLKWATHIIIPFSIQPLYHLYAHIRSINPFVKIIFNVDFNFAELPKEHEFYDIFAEDNVIENVQDNCFFADTLLVNNADANSFFTEYFTELANTKYLGVERIAVNEGLHIEVVQLIMDEEIMLENLNHVEFKEEKTDQVTDQVETKGQDLSSQKLSTETIIPTITKIKRNGRKSNNNGLDGNSNIRNNFTNSEVSGNDGGVENKKASNRGHSKGVARKRNTPRVNKKKLIKKPKK